MRLRFFVFGLIKYLGSKRTLLSAIRDEVRSVSGATSVLDLFSGTSRVGHMLKGEGLRVVANDHNAYAHTLARCYVCANREDVEHDARALIAELQRLPGAPGYFTETFCQKSRFVQPKNGERIDAIRDQIEKKGLDPILKAVLLVSLMEAADRVDSTCGVQMAYLKKWSQRSHNDLELRFPDVLPRAAHGTCEAHCFDAAHAARVIDDVDVAYLDPPYNQHSYLGNYHVWESLVRWDKPEVYGTACKRTDVRERKSEFNMRRTIHDAMRDVIDNVRAKVLIVSFSNEGYITRDDMEALLRRRGDVMVREHDFKRYVGAQIGIHNHKGEVVGEVSHLRNVEYLYVVNVTAASSITSSERQIMCA